MSEDRSPKSDPTEAPQDEPFEPFEAPAIIALGKLDAVTFGATGPPFEGATSYL